MKKCWLCDCFIDIENDKWRSVDLRIPNSKGADVDIHEDCLGAFHETRVTMKNRKVEVGKCWFCNNSVRMYGNEWECIDLCVPQLKQTAVDIHSDCLAALRNTMDIMKNIKVKKSQDTSDNLLSKQ